jgi:hypothetical protein
MALHVCIMDSASYKLLLRLFNTAGYRFLRVADDDAADGDGDAANFDAAANAAVVAATNAVDKLVRANVIVQVGSITLASQSIIFALPLLPNTQLTHIYAFVPYLTLTYLTLSFHFLSFPFLSLLGG